MEYSDNIFTYLSIAVGVKLIGSIATYGKKPQDLECVGHVSKIILYPGKSMGGVELEQGLCTRIGLRHTDLNIYDRSLVVVKDDKFVVSKLAPKISTIRMTLDRPNQVTLKAKGMTPLNVDFTRDKSKSISQVSGYLGEAVESQDCGDAAAKWVSDYLETDNLRLVVAAPGLQRRKLIDRGDRWTADARPGDEVMFNNTHPYHLTSAAGLKDISEHVGEELSIHRFRPNIVVSGCEAFDEDSWDEIWVGKAKFLNQKPCQRCLNTTVDPESGVKDDHAQPLKTINGYRNVCSAYKNTGVYGAMLVLDSPDRVINVGDIVYVKRKNRHDGQLW